MKPLYSAISIAVVREEIPVSMMHPEMVPDDEWRYVDKQGHGHFWDSTKLPTLEWVVTGKEWVGDEYDGSEVEVGEYRCRQCGEKVKPKKRPKYEPTHISGPAWIVISIDGEEFRLTPEQYEKSVDKWKDSLRKVQRERTR